MPLILIFILRHILVAFGIVKPKFFTINLRDWINKNTTNNYNQQSYNVTMSKSEALEILGLNINATEQEIKSTYNNLIKKVHPDQGGSAYLTRQINLAKKVLIKK
ncbi:DnaJ domain-containing protein [Candidatus Xenohaliotis californiensis]